MNLQGQQIKNTYEGVLNIGSAGLSGSLVTITDGAGNPLPIQVSDTTVNFTGIVTGLTGAAGSSGTSGTSGVNGSSGASGSNGTSGTSGVNGSSGASGSNGTSGVNGVNGSSGTSGVSGANGSSGTSGAAGAAGSSGTSGANGSSGTSGAAGANGSSGTSGANGSSGTSGAAGATGSSGTSGAAGTPGAAGSSGTSGAAGATGAAGSSGTSGAAGAAGSSGSSGAAGAPGAAGSSGTSGAAGAAGSSGTSGANGSSGTSGANGSSGTSGSNGSSGTSGISGSSGTSGINGSSGTSGAAGAAGSSGTSGVSGSSGTSGAAGATGSSGTSGLNGSSGSSGTSGVSGSSGTSGVSGSSGTSGVNGATGPIGPTGSGSSITSPGNNRVITSDGTVSGLVAESNFTFNGTVLGVTGQAVTYLYDNGSFTGTGTVNFNNSNIQALTLTGNTTLTFTNPTPGGIYTLQIIQGNTGGYNITWPVSLIFIDGVPILQKVVGAVDIISVMYDGANYYGSIAGNPQGLVYTSATQAVLAATGGATNINLATVPKGNGAFTLQVPDGTTAGGNARGAFAVDLSMKRDFSSDRVASGSASFQAGDTVKASGERSAVLGGYGGLASGYASTTVGGENATAAAPGAVTLGGNGPSANAFHSVAQGFVSSANGDGSTAIGSSVASNADFSFAGGRETQTSIRGQFSRSGGSFAGTRADSQTSIITVGQIRALAPGDTIKLTTDPQTTSPSAGFGLVMEGSNRTWAVDYQLNYVCTVSSGGANDPVVGDTYTEQGTFLAKTVSGVTTATLPIDYTVVHDPYYTGGKIPVLTTTVAGREVQFNVTTGATTNPNTYRILATLSITEVAW